MKTYKIETWLPVFPGFYGTIFEPDTESEIYSINQERAEKGLEPIDFDQCEFDYERYESEVVIGAVDFIQDKLKDLNVVTSIFFRKLNSPKYYNFSNDSIDIEVELTLENTCIIEKYLTDNIEKFEKYIKNRYTSYSGFCSAYSNDYKDWLFNIEETLQHRHMLGSVLNFICKIEDINDLDMFYSCECYLSADNYHELIGGEND